MRSSQAIKFAAATLVVAFSGSLALALPGATTRTNETSARPHLTQLAAVECMTDEGYGRKRPCDSFYKQQHPDWRATDNCYTDDGYGRKRPCSAGYKRKHMK
jgi:hypothetical protein